MFALTLIVALAVALAIYRWVYGTLPKRHRLRLLCFLLTSAMVVAATTRGADLNGLLAPLLRAVMEVESN